MVVIRCLRLVIRRMVLRKGLTLTSAILIFIGIFCLYLVLLRNDGEAKIRTVHAPTLVLSLAKKISANESQEHHLSFSTLAYNTSKQNYVFNQILNVTRQHPSNRTSVSPSIQLSHKNLMPGSTQECIFSETQPLPGSVDVMMSELFDLLPFDNPSGGVWKQGFELTYTMSSFDKDPLQVYIIPHSHNDPGWLRTFEDYYRRQTRNILNLMTDALSADIRKKFVWAEISYLDLWWNEQNEHKKEQFKRLVSNGQLEIVTGGWVMNDEANTHYFGMLDQLIEGHLWMQDNLPGIIPTSSWANDPFGYSPVMAYLLREIGLDSMMIQRAHYSIKKRLSQQQQLEFGWLQQWDHSGSETSILCHLMPFYSYDIPHTCGPEPKVCCQFDFKRLPGNKVTCPWKVKPQTITDNNIHDRADLLADQYRKKAQLYRTNVLMVPLGDDFRWDTQKEIDAQFSNYFKLINYMNSHDDMKIQVQFGTLSDYFAAVRQATDPSRDNPLIPASFPTLSGDFFTYSDREEHYWSGYYTTRPYDKRLERVLECYLRRAEIFYSLVTAHGVSMEGNERVPELLTKARRNLGLFQHHDGITGTAKDMVVKDYAKRLLESITSTAHVSQAAVKALISSMSSEETAVQKLTFDPEETYPNSRSASTRSAIVLLPGESKVVTLVNSLTHHRTQLIRVKVRTVKVMVKDSKNTTVPCQINPVLEKEQIMPSTFEVLFISNVPALGVSHYTLMYGTEGSVLATVQYINHQLSSKWFHTEKYTSDDFILSNDHDVKAKFSGVTGLIKSMSVSSTEVTIDLDFVSYGTVSAKEKSGAYIFLPNGEARTIVSGWSNPPITITIGPLMQEVHTSLGLVKHTVTLSNSPGPDGRSIAISNQVDITNENNKELAMRFRTSIDNEGNVFYTDLNGFQLIRRRTYSKLPLQGNFYPMPSTAMLQDIKRRFTVLSAQPLGVAALKKGWLEVMLDRRLMQDDNRGLGQGVKDNIVTNEGFRLFLEKRHSTTNPSATLVYPSLSAHTASDNLLHPVLLLISEASSLVSKLPPYSSLRRPFPCDLHLVNFRTLFTSQPTVTESALILHRRGFDCGFDMQSVECNLTNGQPEWKGKLSPESAVSQVKIGDMFKDVTLSEVTETSLTMFHERAILTSTSQFLAQIAPMQIQTYKVAW